MVSERRVEGVLGQAEASITTCKASKLMGFYRPKHCHCQSVEEELSLLALRTFRGTKQVLYEEGGGWISGGEDGFRLPLPKVGASVRRGPLRNGIGQHGQPHRSTHEHLPGGSTALL